MSAYILRRLLLMIPTLLGIMVVNFILVQFAPGGPIEHIIAQVQGQDIAATARIGGGGSEVGATQAAGSALGASATAGKYRGARGLDPEFIAEL